MTTAQAIALIEAASGPDIANLYQAGPSLLKVPREPADNDLMRAETLERHYGPRRFRPFAMPA